MQFFLGAHQPSWLWKEEFRNIPLFISRVRLAPYKSFKPAETEWALDSGGFSELSLHGRWTLGPHEYAAEVRRYQEHIGGMQWAAIQDWMCEDVIRYKTQLTVEDHQLLTVCSYLDLMSIAPEIPWVPVIQGFGMGEYFDHIRMYQKYGVDLSKLPLVGVGSVCRRGSLARGWANMYTVISYLADDGYKLHGFGLKSTALGSIGKYLESSDSMAWSFDARQQRQQRMEGCTHPGKCQNCPRWARRWRDRVLAGLEQDSLLNEVESDIEMEEEAA